MRISLVSPEPSMVLCLCTLVFTKDLMMAIFDMKCVRVVTESWDSIHYIFETY